MSSLLARSTLKGIVLSGVVINNDDPEKLLRVKVRIPLVHRDITDENLPWVKPLTSSSFSGNTGGTGGISVPKVGAKLILMATDDSLYNMGYMGDVSNQDTIPSELFEDYPNSYGWIDQANNLFFINTKKQEMKIVHSSGSTFEIEQSGAINILSANNVVVSSQSQVDIVAASRVNVHSGSNVDVRAPRIDLNRSTSGSRPVETKVRPKPTMKSVAGKVNL